MMFAPALFFLAPALQVFSYPWPAGHNVDYSIQLRTEDPVFPSDPPSCPVCEASYPSISSCAQAAPVLANFTAVLFNPSAFLDVIKCACTDTFQSAFPQCVDCFEKTNQTDVLDTPDLPSVLNGLRQVCSLLSTVIGGSGVSRLSSASATATEADPATVTDDAPAGTGTETGSAPDATGTNAAIHLRLGYAGSMVVALVLGSLFV